MKRIALLLIAAALTLTSLSGQTLLWFDRANGQTVAVCGPNDSQIFHDDNDFWNYKGRDEFIELCDGTVRRPGNWDIDGVVPDSTTVTVSLGYLPGGHGFETDLVNVGPFAEDQNRRSDVGTLLIGSANRLRIRDHNLHIHMGITNDGTILFDNLFDRHTEPNITLAAPMTLHGQGTILMGDPEGNFTTTGSNEIASAFDAAVLTLAPTQNFRVGGQINTVSAGLVNNTTMEVLPGFGGGNGQLDSLVLNGVDKVNNGVFHSGEGSSIRIEDITVDNHNGIFRANGFMEIDDSTIDGGQLLGTGVYEFDNSLLTGPVVIGAEATVEVGGNNTTMTLQGAVTHDGVLELNLGAPELIIDGPLTLHGSGTLRLNGSATASITSAMPSSVLTIPATQKVEFSLGRVEAGLVTEGLVESLGGGYLTFSNGLKTNNGTWRAVGTGNKTWDVQNADSILTNYDPVNGSLTGGRWEVISISNINTQMLLRGACIKSISPGTAVVLSGAKARFPALDCLEEVAGSLSLRNGQVLTLNQDLAVSGELEFGLNGGLTSTQLVVNGDVDFTGGVIDVLDFSAVDGVHEVVTWTGTATGVPTLRNVPPNFEVQVSADGDSLNLSLNVPEPPEILQITRDQGTDLTTISYLSVDGVSFKVEGSDDLQTYDPLPDTVVGDGSVQQYMHTTAAGTDRFFYRIFRETDG